MHARHEDLADALGPTRALKLAPHPDVSLKASDRYSTPPWLVELVTQLLAPGGSIDCDPFSDPTSTVQASQHIDARQGGNGYVDLWQGRTALVNAGYSGKLPQRTAARVREQFLRGHQMVNVCPAAVGSAYWERDVWPVASAVAFLGRVAFPAGVDVFTDAGELVCGAGIAQGGNRTEIAGVYSGPDVLLFKRLFEHRGHVVVPSC